MCIPIMSLPDIIAETQGGGIPVSYFLFLVVIAFVGLLAYGYHRHRPTQFSALHFDNPIYRRTVEDLESDVENAPDNSLGAISTRSNDSNNKDGEVKLVLAPPNRNVEDKSKIGSSLVDVRDPQYAYDQPPQ